MSTVVPFNGFRRLHHKLADGVSGDGITAPERIMMWDALASVVRPAVDASEYSFLSYVMLHTMSRGRPYMFATFDDLVNGTDAIARAGMTKIVLGRVIRRLTQKGWLHREDEDDGMWLRIRTEKIAHVMEGGYA